MARFLPHGDVVRQDFASQMALVRTGINMREITGISVAGGTPFANEVTIFASEIGGITELTVYRDDDTSYVINDLAGMTGILPVIRGGTSFGAFTTGEILYASATDVLSKLAAGADTEILTLASGVPTWAPAPAGVTDHGALTGLTPDDDHTQYALLLGRAGGQVFIGGTGAGDDLKFQTTSDGTKGDYIFSEMTITGFLKNDASGIVTGGNLITAVSRSAQAGTVINMQGDEIKTQTLAGNTTYTISNPELGRVIIMELDGVFTVTLPGTVTVLNGDYLPSLGTNWLYLQCIDAATPAYNAFWTVTI